MFKVVRLHVFFENVTFQTNEFGTKLPIFHSNLSSLELSILQPEFIYITRCLSYLDKPKINSTY